MLGSYETKDRIWSFDYKTFYMLNSAEHEISPGINFKMPTVVGILTFMTWKNTVLGLYDPEKTAEFLDIFLILTRF